MKAWLEGEFSDLSVVLSPGCPERSVKNNQSTNNRVWGPYRKKNPIERDRRASYLWRCTKVKKNYQKYYKWKTHRYFVKLKSNSNQSNFQKKSINKSFFSSHFSKNQGFNGFGVQMEKTNFWPKNRKKNEQKMKFFAHTSIKSNHA